MLVFYCHSETTLLVYLIYHFGASGKFRYLGNRECYCSLIYLSSFCVSFSLEFLCIILPFRIFGLVTQIGKSLTLLKTVTCNFYTSDMPNLSAGISLSVRQLPGDLCTAPRIIPLSPLSLATNVTDATLRLSDLWLGTRTRAGGTTTLTKRFFGRSP